MSLAPLLLFYSCLEGNHDANAWTWKCERETIGWIYHSCTIEPKPAASQLQKCSVRENYSFRLLIVMFSLPAAKITCNCSRSQLSKSTFVPTHIPSACYKAENIGLSLC